MLVYSCNKQPYIFRVLKQLRGISWCYPEKFLFMAKLIHRCYRIVWTIYLDYTYRTFHLAHAVKIHSFFKKFFCGNHDLVLCGDLCINVRCKHLSYYYLKNCCIQNLIIFGHTIHLCLSEVHVNHGLLFLKDFWSVTGSFNCLQVTSTHSELTETYLFPSFKFLYIIIQLTTPLCRHIYFHHSSFSILLYNWRLQCVDISLLLSRMTSFVMYLCA